MGSCCLAGISAPAGAGAGASAGPARLLKRPFVPGGDTKGSSPAGPGPAPGLEGHGSLGGHGTCPGAGLSCGVAVLGC